MEFQELLEKRRSIRNYDTDSRPEADDIKDLVKAALEAPSWKNTETGRYHCVLSEDMIQKFRAECLPEFNQRNSEHAAYIVTTYVRDTAGFHGHETKEADNELGNGWGCYDLGLQNENLILKAVECGFSTLIMGIRDADKIRELLSIPEEEVIVSVIAIGQAADMPSRPKRKNVDDVLSVY